MFWFFGILLCECFEVVHIPKNSSARSNDTQQYNFLGSCVSFCFFVKSIFISMRGQWQRCFSSAFMKYLCLWFKFCIEMGLYQEDLATGFYQVTMSTHFLEGSVHVSHVIACY